MNDSEKLAAIAAILGGAAPTLSNLFAGPWPALAAANEAQAPLGSADVNEYVSRLKRGINIDGTLLPQQETLRPIAQALADLGPLAWAQSQYREADQNRLIAAVLTQEFRTRTTDIFNPLGDPAALGPLTLAGWLDFQFGNTGEPSGR